MRPLIAIIAAVALACVGGCDLSGPYAPATVPTPGGAGTADSANPSNAVTVGNIVFTSVHNGTANPAVDTVMMGSTMVWTWSGTGQVGHSVQSIGALTFPSSGVLTGNESTYSVKFTTPGTYQYDCAVHGQAMTGTIVVLPDE